MNILYAEDDVRLGEMTHFLLQKKGGYQVEWVQDGADIFDYTSSNAYDLLILDWMMPGESGVEACGRLRKSGYSGPILMLTARDALADRVEGLDAGADDYLVKPFEMDELLARVRALLRRKFTTIPVRQLDAHGLQIDLDNRTITRNGEDVYLTARELQLLELLVRHEGQVLTREQIFDRIWGYDADASLKIIDATVKLLRKKLMGTDDYDFITSVRGVGYRFDYEGK
jgi:DNA-binding response OmpR family regulator